MVLTPHILSGAAFGASINNPLIIVAGATALHFALDAIPHWDYDIHSSRIKAIVKVSADLVAAGIAILFFIWHMPAAQQINVLTGSFFGVLPDGILFLNIISKKALFARYVKFHHFWHRLIAEKNQRLSVFSVLPQILVAALSIYALAAG